MVGALAQYPIMKKSFQTLITFSQKDLGITDGNYQLLSELNIFLIKNNFFLFTFSIFF